MTTNKKEVTTKKCYKLLSFQLLSVMNLQRNGLKSLKGLESCHSLRFLLLSDNQIKDKKDLENLNVCDRVLLFLEMN